jgi:hypothetical protein
LAVSSGPGVEVSITPAALATDCPCRTSVNVMVRGPAARADPQLAANTTTTMAAKKRRAITTISPMGRRLGALARSFTREV